MLLVGSGVPLGSETSTQRDNLRGGCLDLESNDGNASGREEENVDG